MRKFKLSLICLFALVMMFSVTACGKNGGSGAAGSSELRRDEFIGRLGDAFGYDNYVAEGDIFSDVSSSNSYYNEIQASAEWDVLENGGKFNPGNKATLGFALESAVKAIGVDNLESIGLPVGTDYAKFYSDNIAQIDTSDLNRAISGDAADAIISAASDYRNNMVRPQITEVELVDGVKFAGPDITLGKVDGVGEMGSSADYKTGDIIYFEPDAGQYARAIKITGVDGTSFTYEDVSDLESVFAQLKLSGTFDGKVMAVHTVSDDVTVTDGLTMYEDMKNYGMSFTGEDYSLVQTANGVKADSDIGSDHVMFTVSYDTKDKETGATGHAEARIGIKNIKIDADYDHEFLQPWNPKKVGCRLKFDTEIATSANGSVSKAIPLGDVDISVWGPIYVKVSLTANIGADGEITIAYTTKNVLNAQWEKGRGFSKSFESTPSLTIDGSCTLTAELTCRVDLRAGFWNWSGSVVNAQVTSGMVAVATIEGDFLDPEPTCIDLLAWVPLRWGINQESCALTKINKDFMYKQDVWTSENSPVKLHYHFEDMKRTPNDECTRGKGKEVVQEDVDEEGKPLDEYKIFDFEPLDFDFIVPASYAYKLDKNGSASVSFTQIPEGYSENDLVYSIEDGNVCKVSDGTITAVNPGSTIVKISSSDGMFNAYITVTVNEDYASTGFTGL